MRRDDPLADPHHLPWRQLANRDIAVFSKGNSSRLVSALAESHRLNLTARYQVDFLETLYGLVRSQLAVAILPQLYTTHLNDEELTVIQLQQPLLSRTVALMRSAKQNHSPLIEKLFPVATARFSAQRQVNLNF
ncbi:LysR substrate binding domain [Serratia fonticola]|uniref:LysR substrate binding domain n=1 Tax=Serratia fonticola TaxID=47917 RepID=A0A4U9U4A8_SERFO|nr:LysR substrate binding domain [Serratia fonticola]